MKRMDPVRPSMEHAPDDGRAQSMEDDPRRALLQCIHSGMNGALVSRLTSADHSVVQLPQVGVNGLRTAVLLGEPVERDIQDVKQGPGGRCPLVRPARDIVRHEVKGDALGRERTTPTAGGQKERGHRRQRNTELGPAALASAMRRHVALSSAGRSSSSNHVIGAPTPIKSTACDWAQRVCAMLCARTVAERVRDPGFQLHTRS